MKETTLPRRMRSSEDVAQGVKEALLGEAGGFLDELYDLEGIDDEDLRPLVAGARADSARFLRMARDKLKPASCEVLSAEQRGTTLVVRLLLDGATQIDVVVDDLHERGGSLHTRDVLQIRLPPP